MTCNLCGKHKATILFKGLINDQAVKLHLCEPCAKKKGFVYPFGKSIFSLGDMVDALARASIQGQRLFEIHCPVCHMTYAEFKQTSQLGCSRCYVSFSTLLGPLLQRLHGSSQHVGKQLIPTVHTVEPVQELARLKLELRESLQREAYEAAAALRDQIRLIEDRLKMPR